MSLIKNIYFKNLIKKKITKNVFKDNFSPKIFVIKSFVKNIFMGK